MSRWVSLATISFLIVLCGLTFWLLKQWSQELRDDPSLRVPDSYLYEVEGLSTDDTGQVNYRLTANTMIHYPKEDITFFEKIAVWNYLKAGEPWTLAADHGRAQSGKTSLDLWGNVKVHQAPSEGNTENTLLTTALTLYPKQRYAKTASWVTLLQPGITVTALGAEADMETKTIHLLAHAKGILLQDQLSKTTRRL